MWLLDMKRFFLPDDRGRWVQIGCSMLAKREPIGNIGVYRRKTQEPNPESQKKFIGATEEITGQGGGYDVREERR